MSDDEFFSDFARGAARVKIGLVPASYSPAKAPPLHVSSSSSSSGGDSCGSLEDGEGGSSSPTRGRQKARRKRRKRRQAGGESLASRLIHNKAIALEPSDEDAGREGTFKTPVKSTTEEDDRSSSHSPSPSPLPLRATDGETTAQYYHGRKWQKAQNLLYQLRSAQPAVFTPVSDSDPVSDCTPRTTDTFTLRISHRGKIHRFPVKMRDPLSRVCAELAEKFGAKGEQVLLSLQTVTIQQSESPSTLCLTTADILDAIIRTESAVQSADTESGMTSFDDSDLVDDDNIITVKVQSKERGSLFKFKLSKTDSLQKAMTAFASAMDVPLSQIRFTFDGEEVGPNQTPQALDMEDDNILDARVISK